MKKKLANFIFYLTIVFLIAFILSSYLSFHYDSLAKNHKTKSNEPQSNTQPPQFKEDSPENNISKISHEDYQTNLYKIYVTIFTFASLLALSLLVATITIFTTYHFHPRIPIKNTKPLISYICNLSLLSGIAYLILACSLACTLTSQTTTQANAFLSSLLISGSSLILISLLFSQLPFSLKSYEKIQNQPKKRP